MTEADIERGIIQKLTELKYTYREDITDRNALEENFLKHFERLNYVELTDAEFEQVLVQVVTGDVFVAAQHLREKHTLFREDGTPLDYTLVNTRDWCKNEFEVVNQVKINTRNSHHRYDLLLLLNGVPVAQIELKAGGVNPKLAMEQIVKYKNDRDNGYGNTLLCFVQLFIISNQHHTYYFANNNQVHFQFDADERFLPIYQMADEDNKKITSLHSFAERFLKKCALGQLISRYMVLVATERRLLIMRPYQIYAVKAIIDCVNEQRGNGYIWHTTGSGKTLTSFKVSTLLKQNPQIEKCLFVVDRKDLDRQTRAEFNKFQEQCVEENTNTAVLVTRLLSGNYKDKVIVTTIQKLGLALGERHHWAAHAKEHGRATYKERLLPLRDKRMVIIFDECHRSQFGEQHKTIREFFPQAQLFGFTGTPIFAENATKKKIIDTTQSSYTTEDIFEKELHAYTISHAIDDRNVLGFHVDYIQDANEQPIKTAHNDAAKREVVRKILQKHDALTRQRRFNALFATASINDAIAYYRLFKQEQADLPEERAVNVACIFSPPAEGNKDIAQLQDDLIHEQADNRHEPQQKKKALSGIVADYNVQYGTAHSIAEFDSYYQDVQQRIKDHEYSDDPRCHPHYPHENKIDITIVVDMLLTGFDARYLNTLYVDKDLKDHSLIQALSRTNRVLNATKPHGNIIDFRRQRNNVDDAIALFSGLGAEAAEEIWLVDDAKTVIERFDEAVDELKTVMESYSLSCTPEEVGNLRGDTARVGFMSAFKEVQRLASNLEQYTELTEEQHARIEECMPKETMLAFRAGYLDIVQRFKEQRRPPESDDSPIIDDTPPPPLDYELSLFASVDIDYDYIMNLIANYTHASSEEHKMTREQLVMRLRSASNMLDERDDIVAYVDTLPHESAMTEDEVRAGYEAFKEQQRAAEVDTIAAQHGIAKDALVDFINAIIERMVFDGEALTDLLEPLGLRWAARVDKEEALMAELVPALKKRANGRTIAGLSAYE